MQRLAIISSHPIQYYAPWFGYIAGKTGVIVRVFYLWDFGVKAQLDSEFQYTIKWDIPLLQGYDYEFVPNTSQTPGTSHFWGLQNPLLIQRVKDFAPTAVLLMNYKYASIFRFIWQWKKQKVPLLFRGDSHRLLPKYGIKEILRRKFIEAVYRNFGACLYVGKANFDYFLHHGVPPTKLFFSPHAIDNDRFMNQCDAVRQDAIAWKAEVGIPLDHRVILFAGKFSEKKRPFDLLQAFLAAQLQKVSLLFVGAGSLELELRSVALGCSHIYFAPFQNQTLMPRTYAAGDILVLPSYGEGETWGLAINEAMCMARPVIVSNHVGCAQDLVVHGQNGLIFPAGDVAALSQALRDAFDHPAKLREWGAVGQKNIASYSYVQSTEGLLKALHHVKTKDVEKV